MLRLKGITCGMTHDPPPRKRSRSLPMPKISPTCGKEAEVNANCLEDKKASMASIAGLGSDLSSDQTSVKRCSSLSACQRKKSIHEQVGFLMVNPMSQKGGLPTAFLFEKGLFGQP